MFFCEFGKNIENTFFRTPPAAASVQLYRIWMNSKTFLKDFYYKFQNSCCVEQFPFRVTLSSYLSDKQYFRTSILHNSYLQEQPPEVFYKKSLF